MEKIKKLGFKDLGVTPSCPKCGQKYSNVNDISVDHYDISKSKPLHVCNPIDIKKQKLELKEVVKDAIKEQNKILKSKEINFDQLNKPFNI